MHLEVVVLGRRPRIARNDCIKQLIRWGEAPKPNLVSRGQGESGGRYRLEGVIGGFMQDYNFEVEVRELSRYTWLG